MADVIIRSIYNRPSLPSDDLKCLDKSLTIQSQKKECDINEILKKYTQTGEIIHLANTTGKYGDFSKVTDFKTAVDAVNEASKAFMSMPAQMRARFDNDPQKLLDFLDDPKNIKEAQELGLVEKPVEKPDDKPHPAPTA